MHYRISTLVVPWNLIEVFMIKDQFKDFGRMDFEKTTKIKNIRKTQFFSLQEGVIPEKTVEMHSVPKVRGEGTGTTAFQIVSKAGSVTVYVTVMYIEHVFHGNFSSILIEDMSNFNLF